MAGDANALTPATAEKDAKPEDLKVNLYSVSGQFISTINVAKNQSLITMDIANITPGMYFIQVIGNNFVKNASFVKQ